MQRKLLSLIFVSQQLDESKTADSIALAPYSLDHHRESCWLILTALQHHSAQQLESILQLDGPAGSGDLGNQKEPCWPYPIADSGFAPNI